MFIIRINSKFLVFISLIIIILSVSAVSADESVNGTVIDDMIIDEVSDVEMFADGSPKYVVGETTADDDLLNFSECSSIVLHVSDSEGVISVRRDATNAVDIQIETGAWGNIEYLKQYKNPDGYFAHAIVTSNGWLIGNGGVTDGSAFRQIESIASEMVVNNVISDSYLSRIHSIISRYSLGHFVIKSPDGTYGVVFTNLYHVSKLEPGQFVVCPNVYSKSQKGTYDSTLNPVDAAIRITYADSYGVNRRNVQTYHWKLSTSSNGLSFAVDTYTSNDNGAGVGRSTASLVDNVNYLGNFVSKSSIPATPNKLYLGSHVFEKTSVEIFNLLSPIQSYMVGENFNINYQVNYISGSSPVVRFSIPEGVELNSATLSKGTYAYDASSRVLTWQLNDCNEKNYITLSLRAVQPGNPKLTYSLNHNFVNSLNLYITQYGAKISSNNIEKYFKGPERLNVRLSDVSNNPIVGQKVSIKINGIDYTRTTNENGVASIGINLNPGEYDISSSYSGLFGSNSTVSHISVLSTISGQDIVKMFRNDTQYYAFFKDTSGNPLVSKEVNFNINGVFYTRTTDGSGRAKLNINLNDGTYIITAINPLNGNQHSNTIRVLPILVDGHDLTKYYRNDSVYSIKLLDDVGNPLANRGVTFNINGVFYTRQTNDTGYANLNIRLQPGDYIVTAEYKGYMYSNIIKVLPVLFGNDTISYNETNHSVRLIDGQGNAYANQTVEFDINGVKYNNVTDENGIAKLILDLPNGEYVVTSSYDEYSISNKITINSS